MEKHCLNCSQYFDPVIAVDSDLNPMCLFGFTLGTTMGPFFRTNGEDTKCPFWQHEAEVSTK